MQSVFEEGSFVRIRFASENRFFFDCVAGLSIKPVDARVEFVVGEKNLKARPAK